MAGHVADVPGRGRAAARKLRRDVHDRHEVELHPPEGLRLVKPEQPALVQELLVLADEHAGVLGALGALAQNSDDLPRPLHRLGVADAGEITAHRLRQRTDSAALVARAGHLPLHPPASNTFQCPRAGLP